MLSRESIDQAEHILNAAKFRSIKLQPANGSPLASIVGTLVDFTETGTHEDLYKQSITPNSTTGTHEELEDRAIRIISRRMNNIIDVAKNVVNPHGVAIIDRIKEARKNNALNTLGIISNIKQVEVPQLFTDKIFEDLIENYNGVVATGVTGTSDLLNRILTTISPDEYDAIIKIGTSRIDNKIDDYFGSLSENYLFPTTTIDIPGLPLKTCVWYLLFFTGVQNVRNDKLADLVENSSYNAIISKIIASAGAKIHTYLKVVDSLISKGDIVFKSDIIDPTPRDVLPVIAVNYKKWIKDNNGSPEAVIGYHLTYGKSGSFNDNDLVTNPDKYRAIYHDKLSHAKSIAVLEDISLVRRETSYYMADVISNMPEVNRVRLQQQLSKALDHEYHGASNLSQYVIKVVSRSLYANGSRDMTSDIVTDRDASHDIKDLLLEMESILLDQPDRDFKYAETLATTRLIARWLAKSIVKSENRDITQSV